MKTLVTLVLIICSLAATTAAQNKNQVTDLKSMVETERAFSLASEEKGIRESFAEFIADDGILFRPGPVLGKKWMQEHPLPASPTRSVLSWEPIFADVSPFYKYTPKANHLNLMSRSTRLPSKRQAFPVLMWRIS